MWNINDLVLAEPALEACDFAPRQNDGGINAVNLLRLEMLEPPGSISRRQMKASHQWTMQKASPAEQEIQLFVTVQYVHHIGRTDQTFGQELLFGQAVFETIVQQIGVGIG